MRRRTLKVWQVAVIIVVMLLVGGLLGADPLHSRAEALDPSFWRTAAVAVTRSLVAASEFLQTDRPWEWATGSAEAAEASICPVSGTESGGAATSSGSPPRATTTTTASAGTATASSMAISSTTSSTTSATTSSTTTTTTTTTTLPLFTDEEPLRVLAVGDSMMMMVGYGMTRQEEHYPAMEVEVITKVSSGLVRPDFFDWPKRLARALDEFQPHVTLMLFGGNEKQTMRHEGQSFVPFSEGWSTEYARRVADAVGMVTDSDSRVIWLGMPVMRSQKFSETCRRLNAFYAAAGADNPDATYVDGYSLFADEQGEYSAYLLDSAGKRRLMREKDGIHLTNAGGDRAAAAVMEVLLRSVRLE